MPYKVVSTATDQKIDDCFIGKTAKKTPGVSWRFSILWAHIFYRAKILVPMAEISVCQIQIGILCHGNTTVPQNPAERVNIHTVHQAALGKIVSECVWRIRLLYTSSSQIPLEARFKGVDLQRHS